MIKTLWIGLLLTSAAIPVSVWAKEDQCVMRGCGIPDITAPCVYNGGPKELRNKTSFEHLQRFCPTSGYELGSLVCCTDDQVEEFSEQISMLAMLFQGCPSCMINAAKSVCDMICSPKQSDFLKVTETVPQPLQNRAEQAEVVKELSYFISDSFVTGSFDSCKNVLLPQGNVKAMNLACGSWGEACTAYFWYDFMGNNPFSPIAVNYQYSKTPNVTFEGQTFIVMNDTVIPCSEPVQPGQMPCSCDDCPCDVPLYQFN